ncbi:hypothetical protein FOQG_18885 [Fusarium oxysporum f. sp. raphani 54005]|uniref:Uncharacterized protein n=1 Tax=Fusarium oxysporum f. sp. raphani 54005 TaxID=1089458 RepID=X0B3P8_FUSOX|nr:hypothetical protein FOQG_18982 [Fusarium oxysporum f. sp. raphani 54005]EXK76371.1 hypothetical protein FOQG_18885 [Fusarium oxysporum f. sp. raphani 54005]
MHTKQLRATGTGHGKMGTQLSKRKTLAMDRFLMSSLNQETLSKQTPALSRMSPMLKARWTSTTPILLLSRISTWQRVS